MKSLSILALLTLTTLSFGQYNGRFVGPYQQQIQCHQQQYVAPQYVQQQAYVPTYAQFIGFGIPTYMNGVLETKTVVTTTQQQAQTTQPHDCQASMKAMEAKWEAKFAQMAQGEPRKVMRSKKIDTVFGVEDGIKIANLLENSCLKCHSGPRAKAGYRLDGEITLDIAIDALTAVAAGEMPEGNPLPKSERLYFKKLVKQACVSSTP